MIPMNSQLINQQNINLSYNYFSDRGKVKVLKLLIDNGNFQDTSRQIGERESWTLSHDILLLSNKYVT